MLDQKNERETLNKYAKAIVLAYKKHEGQKRKVSGEPFVMHPIRVSELVLENYASHKDIQTLRVSAILHDVLEDTNTTKKTILDEFGEHVLRLVEGLSIKKADPEIKDKHGEYLERLKKAEDGVLIIKQCDIEDNLCTIDENKYWLKYLEESKEILSNIKINDDKLKNKFQERTRKLIERIDQEIKKRI